MRIIDTAIPKLGDTSAESTANARRPSKPEPALSTNAFSVAKREEYLIEEDEGSTKDSDDNADYYDAEGDAPVSGFL